MEAAIITIGDEILIGQVIDINSAWMASALNDLGIMVGEIVTISDSPEQIRKTLDRYIGKYGLILMTGGLGPTKDDLTKAVLAQYFGGELVENREILSRIETFFADRGRKLIESNRLQAMIPESCEPLMNEHGTAPGMWFEKEKSIVISMPGVPYEMRGIMEDHVIPRLEERIETPAVIHKTIMTQGVPESYLAAMLRNWEAELPDCIKLAYLPRPGIVRLRLTVTGKCIRDAELLLNESIDKLLEIISVHVFGYDDVSLEQVVGEELRSRGLTLGTAESCTGGNIASLITSVPGSSDYFRGSVIAYHNEVKQGMLGVSKADIEKHGAVSREVVEQMAEGLRDALGTNTSIATSGLAGPSGGTEEKPVGTTWIAVSNGKRTFSKMYRFGGNRERIIDQASLTAINLLRRLLNDSL